MTSYPIIHEIILLSRKIVFYFMPMVMMAIV